METLQFIANIASIIGCLIVLPLGLISLGLLINKKKVEALFQRNKRIDELKALIKKHEKTLEINGDVDARVESKLALRDLEGELATLEQKK